MNTRPEESFSFDVASIKRVISVLTKWKVLSEDALYWKVTECSDCRPEPARLAAALNFLSHNGFVVSFVGPDDQRYYHLSGISSVDLAQRKSVLFPAMVEWAKIKKGEGKTQLARLIVDHFGNNAERHGQTVYLYRDLGISLLTKNEPEWLSADDPNAWRHILESLDSFRIPAFLSRQSESGIRALCSQLRIPLFDARILVLPPILDDVLIPIRDKSVGGLKDVQALDVLPEKVGEWLEGALWKQAQRARKRLGKVGALVHNRAQRLADSSLEPRERLIITADLMRRLREVR